MVARISGENSHGTPLKKTARIKIRNSNPLLMLATVISLKRFCSLGSDDEEHEQVYNKSIG